MFLNFFEIVHAEILVKLEEATFLVCFLSLIFKISGLTILSIRCRLLHSSSNRCSIYLLNYIFVTFTVKIIDITRMSGIYITSFILQLFGNVHNTVVTVVW